MQRIAMEQSLRITSHRTIAVSEIQFRFSRSGGAGGQNVNKVSTRVELVFDVVHSPSLSERQKALITSRLKSRISSDGCLTISSQESRSQWRNREIAIQKFVALISQAIKQTAPRIATKTTKSSRERRLKGKKLESKKKEARRRLDLE